MRKPNISVPNMADTAVFAVRRNIADNHGILYDAALAASTLFAVNMENN